MTNTRTQNRAKIGHKNIIANEIDLLDHINYIEFCEKEDLDPDCYTSALRWIEARVS